MLSLAKSAAVETMFGPARGMKTFGIETGTVILIASEFSICHPDSLVYRKISVEKFAGSGASLHYA